MRYRTGFALSWLERLLGSIQATPLPDAVSSAETSPITLTVDKPYPWKTQVSLTTKLAMQQSAIAMALATR